MTSAMVEAFFASDTVIFAMGAGQSLIDRMDETAFIAACPSGSLYGDGAIGGQPLTRTAGDFGTENYWIDDLLAPTYSDGPNMTSYLAVVDAGYSARTDVNVVLCQLWNAERFRVTADGTGSGNMTIEEYTATFNHLVARFREEHGSDVVIVLGLPHRRTSSDTGELYGSQKIREAYLNLVDSDDLIFGVEHCDIDLSDATHHTTAGETEFGTRLGGMSNYAINNTTKPDYPVLQSATIDYNEVTCVFDTDITAPSAGVGQCAGESGGLAKAGTTLIRTGANTAKFTLASNVGVRIDDSPTMRIGSSTNSSLASTDADTLNNGAGTLPARSAYVTMTDANPITSMSDVKLFVDAKHSTKTYSAGAVIDTIEGLKGAGLNVRNGTGNVGATYDAALFSGRGGFKDVGGATCMQNIDGVIGADTGQRTIFGVMHVPATFIDVRMMQFGLKDGSTNSNNSIFLSTSGFKLSKSQAGGFPFLSKPYPPTSSVFCFRYNSTSSLDTFINSTSVATSGDQPVDPNTSYTIYDTMHLFSRQGQADCVEGMGFGAFGLSDVALTDTQVGIIMTELGAEFGVTIT